MLGKVVYLIAVVNVIRDYSSTQPVLTVPIRSFAADAHGRKSTGGAAPDTIDRYLRFPRGKVTSRFIGKGGENVRKLEEKTLTRMSFMQDRITLRIRAKTASEADRAVRVITKHVGEELAKVAEGSKKVDVARRGDAADAGKPLQSPLTVCHGTHDLAVPVTAVFCGTVGLNVQKLMITVGTRQ